MTDGIHLVETHGDQDDLAIDSKIRHADRDIRCAIDIDWKSFPRLAGCRVENQARPLVGDVDAIGHRRVTGRPSQFPRPQQTPRVGINRLECIGCDLESDQSPAGDLRFQAVAVVFSFEEPVISTVAIPQDCEWSLDEIVARIERTCGVTGFMRPDRASGQRPQAAAIQAIVRRSDLDTSQGGRCCGCGNESLDGRVFGETQSSTVGSEAVEK